MFTPCTTCRRHIRAEDAACPFCGDAAAVVSARPRVTVGRLTRAAIFAGAVLAGGCWTTSTPASNVEKPAQGTKGRVTGQIIIDSRPFPNAEVLLVAAADGKERTAVTDDAGNFVFGDLPPGEYTIMTAGENRTLMVSAGADTVANFAAASAVKVREHEVPVDMPYGAPPARRRTV